MRFNVSKADLQTELSHLVRVTEKKNTIPILSTVLIETGEDSIRLVATDLDVGLVTTCEAEVSEPGAAVLSAKKLFEIVRNLAVGINSDRKPEFCPNDGTVMQPLTWRQDAEDANRVALDLMKQVRRLQERVDQLEPRMKW